MENYDKQFYKHLESSHKSSLAIVPIIQDLVNPSSVVDIGCGIGQWLSLFVKNGIKDVIGVDSADVPQELLKIHKNKFIAADLKKPLSISRKFDLVISLEVAEHLPKEKEDIFINSLTNLGDIVLFSAAIPSQGGTHHVNEQWQDYWQNKFHQRGYVPIDIIRPKIWDNNEIIYNYCQNIIIYVKEDQISNYPKLSSFVKNNPDPRIRMVHPKRYIYRLKNPDTNVIGLRKWLEIFPVVLLNRIKLLFK